MARPLQPEILIDEADRELVESFTWSIVRRKNTSYARGKVEGRNLYLHQLLCPGARLVDHKNRNGLDCRRDNLGETTRAENDFNSGLWASNTSGIKGVSWHKVRGMWRATITVDRRAKHLGHFNTKEEAADARQRAEKQVREAEARRLVVRR